MTEQIADGVLYEGKMRTLLVLPLEPYFATLSNPPIFEARSTWNYRGYAAHWEVEDSELYLTHFSGWLDGREIRLDHFFGEVTRVSATWFTGDLPLLAEDVGVLPDFDDPTISKRDVELLPVRAGRAWRHAPAPAGRAARHP